MVQRTVLKVDISCLKCKKQLLKAVSGLEGVDKIEVDEAKGTLTVTGNADPYDIIVRTRKAGKRAEVVSIGPPQAPSKQEEKTKPDGKKPDPKPSVHDPHTCPQCQRVVVVPMGPYYEPSPSCSVM